MLASKLKHVIIQQFHDDWIQDMKLQGTQLIPTYKYTLSMLGLNSIYFNTVYCWMLILGHTYDGNKQSYYMYGHNREDVVKDIDDMFLDKYFEAELQFH